MKRIMLGGLALLLCGAAAPASPDLVVELTLTPRAATRLAELGEGITVSAMYSGEATRAHRRHADSMGEIGLGMDRVTVAGKAQRVVVPVRTLRRDRFSWVKGGQPHLLINVFTARRKRPDNLLACGIYDGPLAAVAGKPIAIACDLI